jgi:uncharacterized protein
MAMTDRKEEATGTSGAREAMDPKVEAKMVAILKAMADRKGLVVAFSGGVDSTVVAKLARDALGERAVAVTADSESLPRSDLDEARQLAQRIGIEHLVIRHTELENEKVVRNPENRCFHCKMDLADLLKAVAEERDIGHIADGVNVSDLQEHRPGITASDQAGIWHPFIEFEVSKEELRAMAQALDLPIHDKPASACLSSRIPYGERITKEKLAQVEDAEEFLRFLGFRHVRVRHHGDVARIEVPKDMLDHFKDPGLRDRVTKKLKELGFKYVTLDLSGYRAGSMDEVL